MVILNHIEGYYRELVKLRLGVTFKNRNHVIAEIGGIQKRRHKCRFEITYAAQGSTRYPIYKSTFIIPNSEEL